MSASNSRNGSSIPSLGTASRLSNRHVALRAAKKGDVESLSKLLQAYQNYLKILATTQLQNQLRARVSASDLVQETLMEAHQCFPQFRGTSDAEFAAWLRQILVHNLSSAIQRHVLAKKRDVRREVSIDATRRSIEESSERLGALIADPGPSPSEILGQREDTLHLADLLEQLSDDHRTVLVLRHVEGLPFQEVADRMGRSSGAARVLWLRAIERLRTLMAASVPRDATKEK